MKRKTLACILVVLILGYLGYRVHTIMGQGSKDNSRVYSVESSYNADTEIAAAKEKYAASGLCWVINNKSQQQDGIVLCFDGLANKKTMTAILDLLKSHKVTASFFVPGAFVADSKGLVEDIVKEEYTVGNYSLSARAHMEELGRDQLLGDFARSQKVFSSAFGQAPVLLKCKDTKYTDEVLRAAMAVGFYGVVENTWTLDLSSLASMEKAEAYVKTIPLGAIVSFPLEHFKMQEGKEDRVKAVENFLKACEINKIKLNKLDFQQK